MLSSVVSKLSTHFPSSRRWVWRTAYNALNRHFIQLDWYFLNYGYASADPEYRPPSLETSDEPDRLFIQLYEAALGNFPVEGLNILEVGCGRGGGSSYVARCRKPRRMLGVDRSGQAVAFCIGHHQAPNLTFRLDDAEALSIPDGSFDVVLNVESSHCYASMRRFVAEVTRVLKPGGHFAWADFRNRSNVAEVEAAFGACGLQQVDWKDITPGVLQALDEIHERKRKAIEQAVPKLFIPLLQEFAAIKGSRIYEDFFHGEKVYLLGRYRKPLPKN